MRIKFRSKKTRIFLLLFTCLLLVVFFLFFYRSDFKLKKIYIEINEISFEKLETARNKALDDGLLRRSKNDYVNCIVKENNSKHNGKIRLKGDWPDHLKRKKWSFRIKLEDSLSSGVKTFSLQSPKSRFFLDGYIFHKLLQKNNILSNEMTFVELIINDKSWGIYNMEEHLTSRMIRNQNKPEGIILKFEDSGFFEADILKESVYGLNKEAKIKTYGDKKTRKNNPVKVENAIEIIKKYQFQDDSIYQKFNHKAMGKYYAVCDLTQAYHAMGWINVRFYYNFSNQKMEPIGYDPYPVLDWGLPYLGRQAKKAKGVKNKHDIDMIIYSALYNQNILNEYEKSLLRISDSLYIMKFLNEISEEINYYENEIRKEFRFYRYDKEFLFDNARLIRESLEEDNIK